MALCNESLSTLQPSFRFLFDLEQMKAHEGTTPDFLQQLSTDFLLGPHGLGPVIKYLSDLHDMIISAFERRSMFADEARTCISQINIIAIPLESLLTAFRASVFRGMYDPKGFADLHNAMKDCSYIFGVRDYISVLLLSLTIVISDCGKRRLP